MILVKPSFEIMEVLGGDFTRFEPLQLIETAGRTCYKSESAITSESAEKFARSRLKDDHESVIEHSALTVKFIIDRGVSHELVRHRLCAFSQESTRYCNYKGGVTFIIPPWVDFEEGRWDNVGSVILPINNSKIATLPEHYYDRGYQGWLSLLRNIERTYVELLRIGWSPQQARSILPNALKTEIVVTANFREWRHIFKLRCAKAAHPQMREIMIPLHDKCKDLIPVIFDDL